MKRILILTLTLVVGSTLFAHAQSLQLQTYYPAPFGAYDRLRLVPQDDNPSGTCPIGSLYVYEGVSGTESTLYFCTVDEASPGDGKWVRIPGVWSQNNNYIFPSDTDPADSDNPNLLVGIGTQTPSEKLHIVGDSAKIRIEGTNEAGMQLYQGGGYRGYLGADSNGDFLLLNPQDAASGKKLFLMAGAAPSLTLDPNGLVGVNNVSPGALLEIGGASATTPYFSVSSSDANAGDIFEILGDNDNRSIFVNTPRSDAATRGVPGQLVIKGGTDNGYVGFGRDGQDYDMYYNGGSDGAAHFVHTGGNATDELVFDWESKTSANPPAKLTNNGDLFLDRKLSIGRMGLVPITIHDAVEFHVHEKDPSEDMVMLLSDAGTGTGVNDGDFPYITGDTIGALMPYKDLAGNGANVVTGGLMVAGFSNGAGADPAGLNLMGVLGTGTPDRVPAVEVDGVKLASGNLTYLNGVDVVLGINYASDPDNNDDGVVILANGNVGIGFDPVDAKPTAKLHVKSTMKIQERDNAPDTCDVSHRGTLYVDSSNALCFCDGSQWRNVAGSGTCN